MKNPLDKVGIFMGNLKIPKSHTFDPSVLELLGSLSWFLCQLRP